MKKNLEKFRYFSEIIFVSQINPSINYYIILSVSLKHLYFFLIIISNTEKCISLCLFLFATESTFFPKGATESEHRSCRGPSIMKPQCRGRKGFLRQSSLNDTVPNPLKHPSNRSTSIERF